MGIKRRASLIANILVFSISVYAGMQMSLSVIHLCYPTLLTKCGIGSTLKEILSHTQISPKGQPFVEDFGDFKLNPGPRKKLVLVAIMTHSKHFRTRDWAIRMTWLKSIPGDVVFFVGDSKVPAPDGMPLVRLNRAPDNAYPPYKKMFELLRYMHEKLAEKYEYFIRADDDVFIKGQELGSLLRSLNSEEKIYMGQYGQGVLNDLGKLGIGKDYFFCMGGPGIVLSHKALKALAPYLDDCELNRVAPHDDTELGRCMEKYLNLQCRSNPKVANIFYHNYDEPTGSFTHKLGLKESFAITLHPVKNDTFEIRLAMHFKNDEMKWLKEKVEMLRNDLEMAKRSIIAKQLKRYSMSAFEYLHKIELLNQKPQQKNPISFWYDADDAETNWESMDRWNLIYSLQNIHGAPYQAVHVKKKDQVLKNALNTLFNRYWKGTDNITLKKYLQAYRYTSPIRGVQHLLQVSLLQQNTKNGNYKGTFIASQRLLPLMFTEEEDMVKQHFLINSRYSNIHGGGQLQQINMIIPVAGKMEPFVRFTKALEKILKQTLENLKVILVIYKDPQNSYLKQIDMMKRLTSQYSSLKLEVTFLNGKFARGVALQHGTKNCGNDSLLLFMDIDMLITETFLHRVRLNTIYGKQVYYPVPFNRFDPETICYKPNCKTNYFLLDKNNGYWIFFAYGMFSIYKKDFLEIGGFNTSIKGWGQEDIEFFDNTVTTDMTIFRTADLTLIHVYHPKYCSHNVTAEQYRMCLDTKGTSYGSLHNEAKAIYRLPEILNVNRTTDK